LFGVVRCRLLQLQVGGSAVRGRLQPVRGKRRIRRAHRRAVSRRDSRRRWQPPRDRVVQGLPRTRAADRRAAAPQWYDRLTYRMRAYFIVAAMLAAAIACGTATAQAYRWVDNQGRVHYTQTPPPPGAKDVQRKNLRQSGAAASAELPYATRVAAQNFPVKLY